MNRDETRTMLPQKLSLKLLKCLDVHRTAFQSLVDELAVEYPDIILNSQDRYSAFYRWSRPYVYVDPQSWRIRFGFFAEYISNLKDYIRIGETRFPQWNTSKGGLIGFSLEGSDDELKTCVEDIKSLILESYRLSEKLLQQTE